jgi:hypothetical protein
MSLSLYEGKRRDLTPLKLLVTANVVLGLCAVLFWEPMSVLIAEPILWATGQGIGMSPELLDYPFVLIWFLPIACACVAWIAGKVGWTKLAYLAAFYPLLYLGLVFGWYHLTPAQWH